MKKMILSSLLIAAATLSSWMPAEKNAATGNAVSIDQFLLIPITPVVVYNGFLATSTALPTPSVTYKWGTSAETNVARFMVLRLHIPTSSLVIFYVNAKTTSFPRNYSLLDNTVSWGSSYFYSVRAESSDQTQGPLSEATEVFVNNVTLNQQ